MLSLSLLQCKFALSFPYALDLKNIFSQRTKACAIRKFSKQRCGDSDAEMISEYEFDNDTQQWMLQKRKQILIEIKLLATCTDDFFTPSCSQFMTENTIGKSAIDLFTFFHQLLSLTFLLASEAVFLQHPESIKVSESCFELIH